MNEKINFYRRAEIVCKSIPYGKVASYGQIALLCGMPANARQVGYALRVGRLGKDIPAYRVVNVQGILSGAASFETYDMQKRLLEGEGVDVQETCTGFKVDLKKFGWKNTMEEAEIFREYFQKQGI